MRSCRTTARFARPRQDHQVVRGLYATDRAQLPSDFSPPLCGNRPVRASRTRIRGFVRCLRQGRFSDGSISAVCCRRRPVHRAADRSRRLAARAGSGGSRAGSALRISDAGADRRGQPPRRVGIPGRSDHPALTEAFRRRRPRGLTQRRPRLSTTRNGCRPCQSRCREKSIGWAMVQVPLQACDVEPQELVCALRSSAARRASARPRDTPYGSQSSRCEKPMRSELAARRVSAAPRGSCASSALVRDRGKARHQHAPDAEPAGLLGDEQDPRRTVPARPRRWNSSADGSRNPPPRRPPRPAGTRSTGARRSRRAARPPR